tara:strand:- start:2344 stop:3852 length:1509 start_codon:yes stop_codon:yes gene_type:complete
MFRRSVLLLLIFIKYSISFSQDTVVFATYNLLRFDGDTDRNIHFSKVVEEIKADIYIAQELSNLSGVNNFLNQVLNKEDNLYQSALFYDDNDIDQALFFKHNKFEILSTSKILGDPRNILVYRMKHKSTDKIFFIFNLHLKASPGSSNESRRATQVDQLIEYTKQMSDDHFYVAAGDFNIYSTDEPAYRKFFEQTSTGFGKFNDIIVSDGKYNNEQFASLHTQSPRTSQFGGGAAGGMDDRFDYILFSDSLFESNKTFVIKDSYTVFGNDGNHYNQAINEMPNSAVSQDIANALHDASDHLPVYARIVFSNDIVENENDPPVINDTIFSINENPDNNFLIGKVEASDPDGDTLLFSIVSGNDNEIFMIDNEGNLKVKNGGLIKYDDYQSFLLIVQVSDGKLSVNSQVTINVIEDEPLSIEFIPENILSIYPNPVNKILYLKIKTTEIENFKIYSINGNLIYESNVLRNDESIDFSGYSLGLYFAEFTHKKSKYYFKIIKKDL